MLTIKHTLKSCAQSLATMTTTLALSSSISLAYASNNQAVKHEPISPIPLTIDVNEPKAQLGKTLFFDTRFSRSKTVSCASCHQLEAGGDDNVAMGISAAADQHTINTPTIFNARYNFRQNWDGSAKTLADQIEMVMRNTHEFNNTWENVISRLSMDVDLSKTFNNIYKEDVTKENIIDALVEYEKTLITPNARFDRYLRNESDALTESEIKGYTLFKQYGCISCHQGINVGGNLFQRFGIFYDHLAERGNISRSDHGKFNATHRQMDKFVFKVPSLRNVAVTAPYLHDGSAKTLKEAIGIMGKTQLGRVLTQDEIALIESFLRSLTGEYNNKLLDETL